jgi:hypothetical protein
VERQIFFNPRLVRFINDRGFSELTLALRAFGSQHVPPARLATEHFARRSQLKTLRHRLLRFASRYGFRHKEPAI